MNKPVFKDHTMEFPVPVPNQPEKTILKRLAGLLLVKKNYDKPPSR